MEREISFKAKSLENGEWIEGYLYVRNDGVHEINFYHKGLNIERYTYEVVAETVCQYTGLPACWIAFENESQECDAWEHDLLEVTYEGKKVIAEVKYEAGMFILASDKFADSYIPLFDVVQVEDGCAYIDAEHVGNIFDNPELLEMIYVEDSYEILHK